MISLDSGNSSRSVVAKVGKTTGGILTLSVLVLSTELGVVPVSRVVSVLVLFKVVLVSAAASIDSVV